MGADRYRQSLMADCGEWFIVADREWVVTFDDRFHEIGTDFLELEAARSHPLFHGTAIARLMSLERVDLRSSEFGIRKGDEFGIIALLAQGKPHQGWWAICLAEVELYTSYCTAHPTNFYCDSTISLVPLSPSLPTVVAMI